MTSPRRILTPLALSLLLVPAAAAAQQKAPAAAQQKAAPAPKAPTLAAIRAATDKYRDVKVALKEGYMRDPMNMCVTAATEGQPRQLGAMGVHYVRPDLLGLNPPGGRVSGKGTHTDFLTPGVLVYEPEADGSMQLVAVENLVWEKAWKDAGHTAPPEFMGNQYYHMVDNPLTPVDEAHGFEPHYELHLWSYRPNPAGDFAPFNARATCANHKAGK
ncbi:MAG TPA: hypothetical protein VFQ38_12870 [Longimicrobiales bacterium]|nr:hypothetical protein [Longimicrobiales bacterium]